jgi:LysM repeat protein
MPKNIRQVGKSNATKKIYVEDYVMTFIKQLTGGDFSGCKLAVLVGQCIKLDNCRNIFISGAVEVKDIDTTNEIVFSNDTWAVIYEDIKKYFVDTEIVGWFIGGPGYMLEEEDKILKAHVDNFAGQDKALLTYDNMEREETFLSYENNKLCKLDGYYIYYEKNEEMQTYMIELRKFLSNEATYDDHVSRDIRAVLQNKKPPEENRSISRLMYAAGTLLAVIILVVGAAMLSNYDQMKSMQSALNDLSRNMEEVQAIFAENEYSETNPDIAEEESGEDTTVITDEADTSEESVDVEVVPGEVEPLEETETDSDDDDGEKDEAPATDEELASEDVDNGETDNDEEAAVDTEENAAVIQEEVKFYTVETGDTLADISYKLYNTYTKVEKIMELNNIENKDFIYVGQKLIVP